MNRVIVTQRRKDAKLRSVNYDFMKKFFEFSNAEIVQILSEMAAFWNMAKIDYKARAYELAAADVNVYPESITDVYKREGIQGLTQIPSVGPRIAKHIKELLTTGHFREYEEFKKKIPVNLCELLLLEGVGPRTIHELWLRLKVKNIKDLEEACLSGKVRHLPRFGVKSEARILQAIRTAKEKHNL
jgi:DNA polymerase (family X)